jgi:beta-glucanase (GH16 family)
MGTYNDANPNPMNMTGWNTIFFDGFNGTSLDYTKWPITYGGSMYWNNAFWWDNGQNTVGNGELTIGMDRLDNGIWAVGGLTTMPYQGAPAGHGSSFLYGRVEIRAKTSVEVEGAGPCFLLWPSDNSWPPEVDILETPKGGQGMFTVHYPGPGGGEAGRGYDSQFYNLDHSQWHTYTLDWLPGRLTLYIDGVKVAETTENVPSIPMSVGLQGHVGQEYDGWYGNPNDTGVNSVDISVDWVRVSQYTGSGTPPQEPPPQTGGSTGTSGADTLTGTNGADSLSGGGGNDRLAGGSGHDTLSGGDGRDTLFGGPNNDRLDGGAGNDALRGNSGNDTITTGTGVDRVLIGSGEGADRVTDFALGTDRVELTGGLTAGQVTATAGAGGLVLRLPDGTTLTLEGVGAASATQLGLKGAFAGGSTPVSPTPSGRVVTGTAGDDWLTGGTGADTLTGGAGSDDLQGLGGNDVLRGGTGSDGLTGGAGADIFVFARGDGRDWIEDFQPGVDRVRLEGIGASEVTQVVETRWSYTGVALSFGDQEVFVAGATARLTTSELVFA